MQEEPPETSFSTDYTQTIDPRLIACDTEEPKDAFSVDPSKSMGAFLSYNGDYPGIDWEPNGQDFTFGEIDPGDTDLSVYERGDFEVSMFNDDGETSNVGSILDHQIPGAAITSDPLEGLSSQSASINAHHTTDDHGLSRGVGFGHNFFRTRSQFLNLTECDGCGGSISRPNMDGQEREHTIAKEGDPPKQMLWCHNNPKCWSACITHVQADGSTLSGGFEHVVDPRVRRRRQGKRKGEKQPAQHKRETEANADTIYSQVLYPCESCQMTIFCRKRMRNAHDKYQRVLKPTVGESMLCRHCYEP